VNLATHINGTNDVNPDSRVGGSYGNGVCSNVICHGGGDSPDWNLTAELSCSGCHGGLDNETGAPPYDLSGNSETTFKGIGAHTIHVAGGDLSDGMDCVECHKKPENTEDEDHIGPELLPAELDWGGIAVAENAEPSWDGSAICANVYCHGEFNRRGGGNTDNNPSWIVVDGTQAQCGSCHLLPPPAPHLANDNCNQCHGGTVDATNRNIIGKDRHVNGEIDFN
jgi:predicted CxxxxCH...CXXCH cytochrome family protein